MRKVPGHARLRCTVARPRECAGFTLVELMFTVLIFGIISAIAVTGLRSWTRAHQQNGTAAGVQSVLREAQQRAVTEGRATCVNFDVAAQTYAMYRGACDDATRVLLQSLRTDATVVRLASPSFVGPSGSTSGVTFKPRGTAWPGTVQVTRTGSSKVWTVSVEGLTGRVTRA